MKKDINVLIIEDDPMVSQLNRKYVEKISGFNVFNEVNIDNKMKICQDDIAKTDLLLLDIFLPEKNGLILLKEIRESYTDIDVIIISASKNADHISEAMHWGIADYLIKPFTFERLKKSLLDYRNRIIKLNNNKDLRQNEIDLIMNKNKINKNVKTEDKTEDKIEENDQSNNKYIRKLPKGLNNVTLDKIKVYMMNNNNEFTTKKLAHCLGLSRVTVQRYLKYMAENDMVKVTKKYGTVGRPKHFYKLIN